MGVRDNGKLEGGAWQLRASWPFRWLMFDSRSTYVSEARDLDFEITVDDSQTQHQATHPGRPASFDVRGILRVRSCCAFHWQERHGDGLVTVAVGRSHCSECVERLGRLHPSWTRVARIC